MKKRHALQISVIGLLLAARTTIGATEMSKMENFDAAPFGMSVDDGDPKTCTIKWAEPRKIRQVVVQFDENPPAPDAVKLQYWHRVWNGKPDPALGEKNAGSVGWDSMDDWTNGQWKDADIELAVDGARWTYTFAPTNKKEFTDIGDEGVGYRKTIKIRLACLTALPKLKLHAVTDSLLQPLTVRIQRSVQEKTYTEDRGHLEIYNGQVLAVRPIEGSLTKVDDKGHYTALSITAGIEADLTMAVDPTDPRYDATVVTVRSSTSPFSFRADEIARGERIFIKDFGVLVTRGDDDITIDEYREMLKEYPGRTVYDRIFDHEEQTLMRAWDHMPLKRPLYFVHGLPGNRNAFRQPVDGAVVLEMDKRWMTLPTSDKDTRRRQWSGTLRFHFGFPSINGCAGRELKDGYLPQVRTWFQDGPIFYEQSTILDTLDGDLGEITWDDPTALFVRIRLVNTSGDEEGTARLRFATSADAAEQLEVKEGRVLVVDGDKKHIRFLIDRNWKGELTPKGDHIEYTHHLAPGDHHTLYVRIPSITINEDEAKQLTSRGFEEVSRRVCDFWRKLTERGTQIHTAEPWLDDFHKAHARHLMVNCFKEIDSDRLHAHVGTFHYGVYPNESAMMISDLDRRGYHDEARRNLDSFLHYQGTVGMNGNFTTKEGQFYGAGGHETGNYNKSHGYVLWLMAEHWWMTRDRDWMEKAAPGLIKGCEWVIQQRRTTMKTNADGSRPIEYGFLPSGSLEDVTDYWYWLATNSATVWGFLNLANALADFGHEKGETLQAEAKAYYDDFMTAMTEARVRAPVVKLRDETYVPKFPSRLYERGRCHGWLRETLEGAIFLPVYKLLKPESVETQWIFKDYEDNLYISDSYGYSIPAYDAFWFDRGGFSMQANLLDGPPPYLYRDEIKHYLRAFFNGFASAFYPEIRMCNEHSLPELGYPAGDHFKSSDESQVTYWLRLIFVHERDNNLYLGQAIPRYWLASGKTIGIENAASYFGPLAFRMKMEDEGKQVTVTLTPPERNNPEKIYLRIRHPEEKKIKNVSVNGNAHDAFDVEKEWIILPGTIKGKQEIIARY